MTSSPKSGSDFEADVIWGETEKQLSSQLLPELLLCQSCSVWCGVTSRRKSRNICFSLSVLCILFFPSTSVLVFFCFSPEDLFIMVSVEKSLPRTTDIPVATSKGSGPNTATNRKSVGAISD